MLELAVGLVVAQQAKDFRAWGTETLERIRRELYLPEGKLYAESGVPGKGPSGPAFCWPAGVMLSALAAGARVDPKFKPWLREYADALRARYWNPAGPVPGFDVLPMPKETDRYYDDNAWMCLALIETHEVLGDKKYLDWAAETFRFVWSGWDEKLGGGIYWCERPKASKNACSNGPAAVACYRLAVHTKDSGYLEKGDRIFAWAEKNLRDPKDALYWDNRSLAGKLEETKWSYNTALMMRAALERGGRTSPEEADAWHKRGRRSLRPALKRWMEPESSILRDEAPFAHLLFEVLAMYAKADMDEDLRRRLARCLATLWTKKRDENGHFPLRWDAGPNLLLSGWRLINQASAARAFFMGAELLEGPGAAKSDPRKV